MLLNRNYIYLLLFIVAFHPSEILAQNFRTGTMPAIPYGHKVVPPPGMAYVPGGSTLINYDQSTIDTNSIKKVSLTSFFIDKTETTNREYRKFVNWVIDSIAIVKYLKDPSYFYDDSKGKNGDQAGKNDSKPEITAPTTAMAPSTDTTHIVDSAHNAVSGTSGLPGGSIIDTTSTTSVTVVDTTDYSMKRINWNKVDHNKIWNSKNPDVLSKLAPMLDENGNPKKELYVFDFKYTKVISSTTHNGKNYIVHQAINVYPDENVWAQDLTNAQTDMYVENYFKTKAYDDYPVVGVTWYQARAFCYWKSLTAEQYYNMPEYMKAYRMIYTLPSEAQWIYAAQGYYDLIFPEDSSYSSVDTSTASADSLTNFQLPSDSLQVPHDSAWVASIVHKKEMDDSIKAAKYVAQKSEEQKPAVHKKKKPMNPNLYVMDYVKMLYFFNHRYNGAYDTTRPIDSTYIHKDPNGMLMNFKQSEGDYYEDGSALTTPVMSFAPNEYGIYNMEGNVAEWTMDAYSPSAYSFVSDLNPVLIYDADSTDADVMKRKVVRGGSFLGNARSMNPFYRDMELQNVAHCYIGFRTLMLAPDVITKADQTRNKTMRGKKTKGKFSGVRLPEIH